MKNNLENIECIMANVKASMAIEGMKPSAKVQAIGRKYLEGKISSKEAIAKIRKYHASAFGK